MKWGTFFCTSWGCNSDNSSQTQCTFGGPLSFWETTVLGGSFVFCESEERFPLVTHYVQGIRLPWHRTDTFIDADLFFDTLEYLAQVDLQLLGGEGGYPDVDVILSAQFSFNDFVERFPHEAREGGDRSDEPLFMSLVCECPTG